MYSLREAADAVGKSKPTIWKLVKNGTISASRNEKNEILIDPAELHRVIPPVTRETPNETSANEAELAVLRVKVEMLQEMLRQEQRRTDEIRGGTRFVENTGHGFVASRFK